MEQSGSDAGRNAGASSGWTSVSLVCGKENGAVLKHRAGKWAADVERLVLRCVSGVGSSPSVFRQPAYQIAAMKPSYHIACLRAVSGFTQTLAKLNDWKGNFQSSRSVARRVNPRCSHSFSALWRNGGKMGKETSSEGAGGKEDATKGGGGWHVQLSLQIRNKLI